MMTDSIRPHRSMIPKQVRQANDQVVIGYLSFTDMGNFGSGREIE